MKNRSIKGNLVVISFLFFFFLTIPSRNFYDFTFILLTSSFCKIYDLIYSIIILLIKVRVKVSITMCRTWKYKRSPHHINGMSMPVVKVCVKVDFSYKSLATVITAPPIQGFSFFVILVIDVPISLFEEWTLIRNLYSEVFVNGNQVLQKIKTL